MTLDEMKSKLMEHCIKTFKNNSCCECEIRENFKYINTTNTKSEDIVKAIAIINYKIDKIDKEVNSSDVYLIKRDELKEIVREIIREELHNIGGYLRV